MDKNEFLKKIRMIESSGGINTNHETVQSGIHKGSSAYGQYGLMPNTIRELARRARYAKNDNPEILALEKAEDDVIKAKLAENPALEQAYAEQLAEHVLNRQQGDEERAAYSWNMGHNLTPERIKQENLDKHPYVEKYRNLKKIIAKE